MHSILRKALSLQYKTGQNHCTCSVYCPFYAKIHDKYLNAMLKERLNCPDFFRVSCVLNGHRCDITEKVATFLRDAIKLRRCKTWKALFNLIMFPLKVSPFMNRRQFYFLIYVLLYPLPAKEGDWLTCGGAGAYFDGAGLAARLGVCGCSGGRTGLVVVHYCSPASMPMSQGWHCGSSSPHVPLLMLM